MPEGEPADSEEPTHHGYVTVTFDDGPETGLTAEASEDDQCDPRFWRFHEVHGFGPKFKVQFEAFASFVKELPRDADGVVIDEDGDEHRYVRVAELPEQQGIEEAPKATRRAPGGYGFIEVVEDPSILSELKGEDPERKKRPRTTPKKAAKGAKRQKAEGDAKGVKLEVADDLKVEQLKGLGNSNVAADAGVEEVVADATAFGEATPDLAADAAADAAADEKILDAAAEDTMSDAAGSNPAPDAPALDASEATPDAEADVSAADVVAADVAMPAAAADSAEANVAAGVPEASPGEGDRPPVQNEGHEAGAKSRVTVEMAKTGRSLCKSCRRNIEKNTVRCGVQGYAGGRSVLLWAHATCFLQNLRAEYASSRRGRCKGSGEEFEIGQIRVGFEVGSHKSWWLPREAGRWTSQVLEASKTVLTTVRGIEELEEVHRKPLLDVLLSGLESNEELKTSQILKKNRKTRATKSVKEELSPATPGKTWSVFSPQRGCVPVDLDESDEGV